MKKNITTIILFVVCFVLYCGCGSSYVPARYIVQADQIRDEIETRLVERYMKYQLSVIGDVGGMAGGRVNTLGLRLRVIGPLSKDELREILVESVEMFLDALNGNEEIRPFLKIYPFTEDRISIMIYVADKNGEKLYSPDISVVMNYNEVIDYSTYDRENEYKYKTEETESYKEALKIVRQGKKS